MVFRAFAGRGAKIRPPPSVSCRISADRKARHGEIRGQPLRSWLGQLPGSTLQTSFDTDRVHSAGIREGLSRVSWKLSCTVLRGGIVSNDDSLLDKKTATGKQPYAIALADRGLMALAGLWENWRSPAGEWVRSFAIVTTTPNQLCAELHNRMPVVLGPEAWPAWLGEEPADPRQLKALLAPYPSEAMACWPVSPRVGNVKNNDPRLIEPIAA